MSYPRNNLSNQQIRNVTLQLSPVVLLFLGQLYNFIVNKQHFRLFVVSPDIFFVFNVIAVLLSLITIIRLTIFYLDIESIDYLILSVMITGIVLSINMNIIMQRYITPYSTFEMNLSEDYFDFYPQRPLLGDVPFGIGILFLIIHSIRVIGWKNMNRAMQLLSIYYFYESILSLLRHGIWAFRMSSIRSPDVASYTYENNIWVFEYISLTHFAFNHVPRDVYHIFVTFFAIVPFIILLHAYISVDTVVDNSEIRTSKSIWILFGILNIVGRLISNFLITGGAGRSPVLDSYFQLWTTVSFLLAALIMLSLILYPENVLISQYQIHHAKKLYKYISDQPPALSEYNSLIDYKQRLTNYVMTLKNQGQLS